MSQRHILQSLLLALCATAVASPAPAAPDVRGELLVGNKSAASVWRLDMADGRKAGEASTGQGPHEIAVAPDGRSAVVADYGTAAGPGNTLTVLDLAGGASRTIRRVEVPV